MSAELHLVKRCEHGKVDPHILGWSAESCGDGSVEVLDPVRLSKVIHDLQDEYGYDTRHDIGLVLIDALSDGRPR